ncbi:Hpt domain-containing protein [Pseudodesulfovibrio tunisiensis]|uniref:Hpt domain-containing protein n=1 Tax=Pseudodesulfovibrio tunisiensis TaxID=463192 RepID=UPI001FB2A5B1|nr:Hpt domain-containing protein [Pseudodesulfovibrio tunisiensis]
MTDDPMVEEFFSEVNDKYYPQVMEGLELLDSGDVGQGIEILARPLHTIKGVTGFMAGYEEASGFTHKVEDFLKKVQAGEVEHTSENITLLSRSVNMIFQVLEMLRDGDTDREEQEEVLGLILTASTPAQSEAEVVLAGVEVEHRGDVHILRIQDKRIHLKVHRDMIVSEILSVEPGDTILLDMAHVLSFGSSAWAMLSTMGVTFHIGAFNVNPDCKQTLYQWGYDRDITVYPDEEAFFTTQ